MSIFDEITYNYIASSSGVSALPGPMRTHETNTGQTGNVFNGGYQEYLKSFEWQLKRQQVLDVWGNRCALCNHEGGLEVHHRTYERLGDERLTDLLPLCSVCHEKVSNKLPNWYDWLGKVDSQIFEGIRW